VIKKIEVNTEELQELIGQQRTSDEEVYTVLSVVVRIVINNPKDTNNYTEVKAIDKFGYYGSFTLDSWLELDKVD
jgi:hypothetical protein